VAIVSLFRQGDSFQFRKFAVDDLHQRTGVGSHLLHYITDFAKNEGAASLWCNARLSAVPFYLKHGFIQTGNFFSKNGFDYKILEKMFEES
jgi:GNAT superfamily N-acetyltransferase